MGGTFGTPEDQALSATMDLTAAMVAPRFDPDGVQPRGHLGASILLSLFSRSLRRTRGFVCSSGWLFKEGRRLKAWRDCYFVFVTSPAPALNYFWDGGKKAGSIDLRGAEIGTG